MRRRDFVTLVGGAVMAWPFAARAEQPVIGILATASAEANAARLRAFHQGLHVAGYVEGDNVKIEYRWAEELEAGLPPITSRALTSLQSQPPRSCCRA